MDEPVIGPFSLRDLLLADWELRFQGKECEVIITRRPHYCDRGRYVANVNPRGRFFLEFDDYDGFPRYYFRLLNAVAEVVAWMKERGQWF